MKFGNPLWAFLLMGVARAAGPPPLELEATIPLGEVHGRIDHMAVDAGRQRLYVAELGNNTIGVVDLKQRRVLRTLTGFKEPQGIGYVAATDTLYVASGGDGTVRLFQGGELTPSGAIPLGEDADNVRVDESAHRLFVGYGSGALAVIDTASQHKIADIPLSAHPESFQLDPSGQRIFVNVPDAHQIAVIDRAAGRQLAVWSTETLRANFPLALDVAHGRVVAVFRHPAAIGLFEANKGNLSSSVETCGDSDDVFVDARRARLYVSCGEGFIDVLGVQGDRYASLGRIATVPGARTSVFSADIDRLFLAVRATGSAPAAIRVFRPTS